MGCGPRGRTQLPVTSRNYSGPVVRTLGSHAARTQAMARARTSVWEACARHRWELQGHVALRAARRTYRPSRGVVGVAAPGGRASGAGPARHRGRLARDGLVPHRACRAPAFRRGDIRPRFLALDDPSCPASGCVRGNPPRAQARWTDVHPRAALLAFFVRAHEAESPCARCRPRHRRPAAHRRNPRAA